MKHIEDHDIGGRLPELLPQVEKGDVLVITRDGKPVARITREYQPLPEADDGPFESEEVIARRKEALDFFREFRKKHSLGGLTYRELIDEGRRY